jgi:hypothetical protein
MQNIAKLGIFQHYLILVFQIHRLHDIQSTISELQKDFSLPEKLAEVVLVLLNCYKLVCFVVGAEPYLSAGSFADSLYSLILCGLNHFIITREVLLLKTV